MYAFLFWKLQRNEIVLRICKHCLSQELVTCKGEGTSYCKAIFQLIWMTNQLSLDYHIAQRIIQGYHFLALKFCFLTHLSYDRGLKEERFHRRGRPSRPRDFSTDWYFLGSLLGCLMERAGVLVTERKLEVWSVTGMRLGKTKMWWELQASHELLCTFPVRCFH